MNTQPREFEQAAGEAMREFALSRSTAIGQYATLLARFGKGEVGTGAFGEGVVKLALEEGVRYVQDAIKLSSAYLGFMSQLTRAADSVPSATVSAKATRKGRPSPSRTRKMNAKRSARTAA